jgi:Septum formation
MGPRLWLTATATAVCLTLSGCEGGDDSAPEGAEGAEPAIGTCWAVPNEDALDPDYWFDESPQVPCSEPHTTETAAVLQLSEPTIAEARKQAGNCWNEVHLYLGIDLRTWVHWGFATLLPSREEIAAGASWMRCDAVFPEWDFSSVRTTTGTAVLVAVDPPAELWACLDEHPEKAKQPFVPCDQPHQYEQTGSLAHLAHLEEYPVPAELAATARRQCAYAVSDVAENIAFTAAWDPPSVLKDGDEIAGACFMFDKTGQPLAPRP